MEHIKLAPNQKITLIGVGKIPLVSIIHAISFAKKNKTLECDLIYNGFTMDIDRKSNCILKLQEYVHWEMQKTK
jgi:hypothetical protein